MLMTHETPPTEFDRVISGAQEAAYRPHAEKACRQYQRGLLTFGEFVDRLVEIYSEETF